jgi:hypothetical protein
MKEDHNNIDISPTKATITMLFGLAICIAIYKLAIEKAIVAIGKQAIYIPSIFFLCVIASSIILYLIFVTFCTFTKGGFLKIRRENLIYLCVFKIEVANISNISVRKTGPLSINTIVITTIGGKNINLSAFLSDKKVIESKIRNFPTNN